MKVTTKGKKVVIEMTAKQLDSIWSIFDSFTDQVTEDNSVYGDCVRAVNCLERAIRANNAKKEKGKK